MKRQKEKWFKKKNFPIQFIHFPLNFFHHAKGKKKIHMFSRLFCHVLKFYVLNMGNKKKKGRIPKFSHTYNIYFSYYILKNVCMVNAWILAPQVKLDSSKKKKKFHEFWDFFFSYKLKKLEDGNDKIEIFFFFEWIRMWFLSGLFFSLWLNFITMDFFFKGFYLLGKMFLIFTDELYDFTFI